MGVEGSGSSHPFSSSSPATVGRSLRALDCFESSCTLSWRPREMLMRAMIIMFRDRLARAMGTTSNEIRS